MERSRSISGFTLLEVLVSLSIVAIAITVMLQLFSLGLRSIAAAEENSAAVVKAEAKMRELLDSDELPETAWTEATPDGYRMDISVTDALKERTKNLQVRVVQVALTTRWYKGTKEKTLTLRTLKTVSRVAQSGAADASATGPKTAGGTASPGASTPGSTSPRMSR